MTAVPAGGGGRSMQDDGGVAFGGVGKSTLVSAWLQGMARAAAGRTDDWQHYAAYTAAEVCHRFLTAEWEDFHLEPPSPR